MSGGSLDYAHIKVEDAARIILERAQTPLHHAFGAHLLQVSEALYKMEWMLSGDISPWDEIEALRAVVARTEEIDVAIQRAKKALAELQEILRCPQQLESLSQA